MAGRQRAAAEDDRRLLDLERLQRQIAAEALDPSRLPLDRTGRHRLLALRADLMRLLADLCGERDRLGSELSGVQRGVEAANAYARMAGLARKLMR